jgi:hypothetical protein
MVRNRGSLETTSNSWERSQGPLIVGTAARVLYSLGRTWHPIEPDPAGRKLKLNRGFQSLAGQPSGAGVGNDIEQLAGAMEGLDALPPAGG